MSSIAQTTAPAAGWLKARNFDLGFIFGIAALALLSGWAALLEPRLFPIVLFADLWLLGYHHVIATYTRLCFDRESVKANRFLLVELPVLVVAGTLALAFGIGLWTLATIYLYWQWFHYTRQSWGMAQAYRRRAGDLIDGFDWPTRAVIYLVPLWGILHRSYQAPETFLGLELRVLPVPALAVDVAAIVAGAAVAIWAIDRARRWQQGRLPLAQSLYILTHIAIFTAGYVAIESINVGWLVVNIWHNAQYVAFVWLFNNQRYRGGVDAKARFLSTLSQSRNVVTYFAECAGIAIGVYATIQTTFAFIAVAPMVVVYQTINFHHYIVGAVIWRKRRRPATA